VTGGVLHAVCCNVMLMYAACPVAAVTDVNCTVMAGKAVEQRNAMAGCRRHE
jgi:hypothetical protein